MYKVEEIAEKILWIDKQKKHLFKADDDSCFRLMNYLFMLSIRWFAKTKTYLVKDTFLCHEHGAYLANIYEIYYELENNRTNIYTDKETEKFINRFYYDMDDSTHEEVEEIAKLDPAYACVYKTKADEYKEMNTQKFEPYYPILYGHTIIAMEEEIEDEN